MMKLPAITINLLLLILFFSLGQKALAQPKSKVKILLLGTYHFANPGMDKFNVKVDDYYSAERQSQILDVNRSLAKFKPEKIFIEASAKFQDEGDQFFQNFKAGKVDISKNMVNEKFQIGLKLAKDLNNDHIYSVDAFTEWFEDKVKRYADSTKMGFYKEFEDRTKDHVAQLNTYFKNHSIKENLLLLNSNAEQKDQNHHMYNNVFPRVGAGDNYIGADLVGEWYKRNIRIYSNILKHVSADDRRILVIFGNGHIPILKQLFSENPDFEIVDVTKFLK
jgi:hypothetical protein